MSVLHAFRHRLRAWLHPEQHERELRKEMEFHLSLDTQQQQDTTDAYGAARRRLAT